jgi:hypothetical protein
MHSLGSLIQRLRDRKSETTLDVLMPLVANAIDERLEHTVRLRERWLEFLLGAAAHRQVWPGGRPSAAAATGVRRGAAAISDHVCPNAKEPGCCPDLTCARTSPNIGRQPRQNGSRRDQAMMPMKAPTLSLPCASLGRCADRGAIPALRVVRGFWMYDAQPMGSSAWPVRWSAFVVLGDYARALLHVLACDEIAARRSRRLSESCLAVTLSGDEGEG